MIIVRRVCQVCCSRCCCSCCNLLQNAITKRYQLRLRLRQEQLHIFKKFQLQLEVITVRVTLGLMLMHSEQIAASAQLFSRFPCGAGWQGGAAWQGDSSRWGSRGRGVTVFIHVYRLQRIQFSCTARHNTLAKKKVKQEETEREGAVRKRGGEESIRWCREERGRQLLWQQT